MENLKDVKPVENFDWDAYEKGDVLSTEDRKAAEKTYDNTLNNVSDHEVIDGTVIAMNKREVVVNIGFKSDGIIPLNEFRYNPDLKVGDTVEVYIENQEDKKGQLVLSHKKARASRSWERVNQALENSEIIKGYIKCRTKGGMIVDVFGIEAFLPGSQIDVKPIRDYDVFVGKTMEFKVVKINQEYRNVVVSHKALIEAELEQQKQEIISKLEKGQVLEGTVKNITSYGVFIDLGGVDGLIHITDLSWGRVNDPHEVVELDQKLNVVILDFDEENHKLSLGHKQLLPNPWEGIESTYNVGSVHTLKIDSISDKGAVVSLGDDIEGFCPAKELVKEDGSMPVAGDELSFKVTDLKRSTRRVGLSHVKTYAEPVKAERQPSESDNTKKAVKKINSTIEKTTLGDISELAALKSKLEKGE